MSVTRHESCARGMHKRLSCSSATVLNNASMVLNSAGKTRSYPRRLLSLQLASCGTPCGTRYRVPPVEQHAALSYRSAAQASKQYVAQKRTAPLVPPARQAEVW
jgi:hypothetical protein